MVMRLDEFNDLTSKELIKYFGSYAAAVAQTRALPTVEDGFKRGLKQAIYANFKDGYRCNKPRERGNKIVSSANPYYWHGDAALYETIARNMKPYVNNVVLYDTNSSIGTLNNTKTHAAQRYTYLRLAPITEYILDGLKENGVEEWVVSHTGTDAYPLYFPTLGYWNLVNGATGIGVGLATSIPAFNLVEMNQFLKDKLLGNKTALPLPDFPTGGVIINKTEVINSLLGKDNSAIKMRANIDYDKRTHTLIITELPYGVFSDTVHGQLMDLQFGKEGLTKEEKKEYVNPGIKNIHDATTLSTRIEVALLPDANPVTIRNLIYDKTSAESFYGINLTLLVDGRHPEQMTLDKAADYFLAAQQRTVERIYKFRRDKTLEKLLINKALRQVSIDIDWVVQTIKESKDKKEASAKLHEKYNFNEIQIKAILSFTLGRLTGLELKSLEKEGETLEKELQKLEEVLKSEDLRNNIIAEKLDEVAEKFGTPRKTKVIDLVGRKDNMVYFNEKGQATTAQGARDRAISEVVLGDTYYGVTNTGRLLSNIEAPKRYRSVFKLNKSEHIVGVGSRRQGKFINLLTDNGKMIYVDLDEKVDVGTKLTHRKIIAMTTTDSRLTKQTMKI